MISFGAVLILSGQGVTLAGAILGYLAQKRGIQKVETKVNNQLDRQMKYNQDLTGVLIEKGIPVPKQDVPDGL
jgi:hypothetical protein